MIAIIIILVFLIVVVFLASEINYAAFKGKMGENNVSTGLSFLPKDKYIVLNDLYFKFGDYTTQIDHLVISVYGIFVIETKNYKGLILGNAEKDNRAQNIWGNKYPFFNPIFQNESHIRFLKRNFNDLNTARNYIYPIVVFLNASELKLSGDCNCVISGNQLNGYIRSFNEEVLPREYCEHISAKLLSSNIKDKKLRYKHIENVNAAKYHYHEKIKNRICPRCGGNLIQRKGKYGYFLGCSNFPSCHYTYDSM